jgi:hypothetical protein
MRCFLMTLTSVHICGTKKNTATSSVTHKIDSPDVIIRNLKIPWNITRIIFITQLFRNRTCELNSAKNEDWQLTKSWATSIQTIPPKYISLWSMLILPYRLTLTSIWLFFSSFLHQYFLWDAHVQSIATCLTNIRDYEYKSGHSPT